MAEKTKSPNCSGCGESDPEKFYKKKRKKVRADGSIHTWIGYYSKCKKCVDKHNKVSKHKYAEWYKGYRVKNKDKQSIYGSEWRLTQKQNWVDLITASGIILKCSECGYDKTFAALDFHHIDPKTKDKSINFNYLMQQSPTPDRVGDVLSELKKCIVICSNCHREFHSVYDLRIKKA